MSRRLVLWLLALAAVLAISVLIRVLRPDWMRLPAGPAGERIEPVRLLWVGGMMLANIGALILALHIPRLRDDGFLRSAVATHTATALGGLALGLSALVQELRPLVPVGFVLLIFWSFALTRRLRRDVRAAELFLHRFVSGATLPDLPPNPGPAMAPLLASLSWATGTDQVAARGRWLDLAGQAAAQEERKRLARDLHDSIKQQLWSIQLSAATAEARWESDPIGAHRALSQVTATTRQAFDEIKALLSQLLPQAIETGGLLEALREQGEALAERSGAVVFFAPGETIPWQRLPAGSAEVLFRSAQEALANVGRHARARNVRIELARRGAEVVLRVEDDGLGFDPGRDAAGMGLANLRRRAVALGGVVTIESAVGAGTTVALRIPLAAEHPGAPTPREWRRALTVERSLSWGAALLAVGLIVGREWHIRPAFFAGAGIGVFGVLLVGVWLASVARSQSLIAKSPFSQAARLLHHASERSRAWIAFVVLCGLYHELSDESAGYKGICLFLGSVVAYRFWRFARLGLPPWRAPTRATRWLAATVAAGGLAGTLILASQLGGRDPFTGALLGGFAALVFVTVGWAHPVGSLGVDRP
jgi:signal transduction histidine kinase